MGKKLPPRTSSKQIHIEAEFVTLPTGEDNERIERLTTKIIQILEGSSKSTRRDSTQGSTGEERTAEEIFGSSFEKGIGIYREPNVWLAYGL